MRLQLPFPGEVHGRPSPLRPGLERIRLPAAAGPGCRGRPRPPRPAVHARRRPGLRDPTGTVRYARAGEAGAPRTPPSAPPPMKETPCRSGLAARGRLPPRIGPRLRQPLADEVA